MQHSKNKKGGLMGRLGFAKIEKKKVWTMENFSQKLETGAVVSLAAYVMGWFNQLCYVLLALIIMDYVTGIVADMKNGKKFDKKLAVFGALKKLLYGISVLSAVVIDYTIIYLKSFFNVDFPWGPILGLGTLMYLIGTEYFSLTQNLQECGVQMPNAPNVVSKYLRAFLDSKVKEIEITDNKGELK